MTTFDSLRGLKDQISTTHHYLLLAVAASLYNLVGDFSLTAHLFVWSQIDAMLIAGSAVAFLFLLKSSSGGERPVDGPAVVVPVLFALVLFWSFARDVATEAGHLFPGGMAPHVLVIFVSTVVYDLYARMVALGAIDRQGGNVRPLFFIGSDVFIMIATGVVRMGPTSELDPWLVPRCYALMAFARSVIEWRLARHDQAPQEARD